MAPCLVLGTIISDSSAFNFTWAAQFSEQFRAGILYPRWMPESFGRLGGPAFYYYPPLPFWLDAVVSAVTLNILSTSHRLVVTALLLLWSSGVTMNGWLESETQSGRTAFIGALVYMAAPYHLLDFYMRGALAEFAAYAVLPLVMMGIRRVSEQQRCGVAALALAIAALLLAHLPTTLLVATTAAPLYALYRARCLRAWPAALAFLRRCAVAGLLGGGLAALYVVPAVLLQPWISAEQFWKPFFQPQNWFLFTPSLWPEPSIMWVLSSIAAALAMVAVALSASAYGMSANDRMRGSLVFWTMLLLVCLVLMSGLVPQFWRFVPLVAKVQFPWRLMVVAEFAAVTALAVALVGDVGRTVRLCLAAALVVASPGVALLVRDTVARAAVTLEIGRPLERDTVEYEPAGYPQPEPQPSDTLGLAPLAGTPLIACTPGATICKAEVKRFGGLHVEVEGLAPTTVTLRHFFFPAWQLDPSPPNTSADIHPTEPWRLVSFTAPAGRSSFELRLKSLPEEQLGWAVSGAALVLLVLSAAFARRIGQP